MKAIDRVPLGDREPVPVDAPAVTAQTMLLLGLLADEGMPPSELADLLDATATAAHRSAEDRRSTVDGPTAGRTMPGS